MRGRALQTWGRFGSLMVCLALSASARAADKPRGKRGPSAAPAATAPPASQDKPAGKAVQGQSKTDAEASKANVVSTEENKEGVKTYRFGAVEVEGRMRSPQLIYFLRRVRAEFLAGDLGHRSFLPELSDTARQPAFR